MRGELDDALARLARRQEVLRRRAELEAVEDSSPLAELTEAVRRVVARHPKMAVRFEVTHGTENASARVAWSDGQPTVMPVTEPAGPVAGRPPSWPMSPQTAPAWSAAMGQSGDSAARLAEMIRRDPSLLGSPEDQS
jgi:hypothetical protein